MGQHSLPRGQRKLCSAKKQRSVFLSAVIDRKLSTQAPFLGLFAPKNGICPEKTPEGIIIMHWGIGRCWPFRAFISSGYFLISQLRQCRCVYSATASYMIRQ